MKAILWKCKQTAYEEQHKKAVVLDYYKVSTIEPIENGFSVKDIFISNGMSPLLWSGKFIGFKNTFIGTGDYRSGVAVFDREKENWVFTRSGSEHDPCVMEGKLCDI